MGVWSLSLVRTSLVILALVTLTLLPLGGFSRRVSCRCCVFQAVGPRHLVHVIISCSGPECGCYRQKLPLCVVFISFLWVLTSRLLNSWRTRGLPFSLAKTTSKPYWKRKVWKCEMGPEKAIWKSWHMLLTGFNIDMLKWTVLVIIHVENNFVLPFFFLNK